MGFDRGLDDQLWHLRCQSDTRKHHSNNAQLRIADAAEMLENIDDSRVETEAITGRHRV